MGCSDPLCRCMLTGILLQLLVACYGCNSGLLHNGKVFCSRLLDMGAILRLASFKNSKVRISGRDVIGRPSL